MTPGGVDARVALALVLAATMAVVTVPADEPLTLGMFALSAAGLAVALRTAPCALARPVRHALPVLALLVITVPLSVPGEPWLTLPGGFVASREGAALAASLAAKATLALVLLAAVTARLGPARVLGALRGLGVPEALVTILALAQRFAGVIGHEWHRLRRAAMSRSPHPRAGAPQLLAKLAALLLVRSIDRSERVHRAMLARGFGAVQSTQAAGLAAHDAVALALGVTALVTLRVAGALLG